MKKGKQKVSTEAGINLNYKISHLTSDHRGITLIALIITIIVMLILVGVSISIAINGGLFDITKKAARETENAKNIEEQLANGRIKIGETWYDSIEDYINDKPAGDIVEDTRTLSIGDYVDYTYDTAGVYSLSGEDSGYDEDQEIEQTVGLKWRVLSINDDGSIDLISETPTDKLVYIKGAEGYNNGVTVLNDICAKQYSNSALGITARSIKIEDIEKQLSEEGKKTREATEVEGVSYGETVLIGSGYYPNLYAEEIGSGVETEEVRIDGLGLSDEPGTRITGYTNANTLTITYSFGGLSYDSKYTKEAITGEMFSQFDSYFIASRCVRYRGIGSTVGFGLYFGGDRSLISMRICNVL